jgi:uracil-DNA glycosylase
MPRAVRVEDKPTGTLVGVMAPGGAAEFLPSVPRPSLSQLKLAAAACEGCELFQRGTQTVFGAGAAKAAILFVGEQPGDQEDLQGKPFVGPAGKLLDKALLEAGIDRKQTYVTNAVKHFYWVPRGKRRLHAKPKMTHIKACRPWLDAELAAIKPKVVVCLGATASQSLLGAAFRVTKSRGKLIPNSTIAPMILATVHPSSILRADDKDREAQYKLFVRDLKVVGKFLAKTG